MLRPRLMRAAPVVAVIVALLHAGPVHAQRIAPSRQSVGIAGSRPLHWGLHAKAEPMTPELPQNAYLSFYVTGAVLIVLGSSLAIYSTVRLYDAVQRGNIGDEVTHAMAVGAEGLLAIVGLAFVILGSVLHSDQSAQQRPPTAGTVHAMLGPSATGHGAFGALSVTF